MSAYINIQSVSSDGHRIKVSKQFHVGQRVMYLDDLKDTIATIQSITIQADGDELIHCCKILSRIIKSNIHTFVGEQALEIILNWEN